MQFLVIRWRLFALVGTLLVPLGLTPAQSCGMQIQVTYVEASPDLFRIDFLQGPARALQVLGIDLRTSLGRAYVDTHYGAAQSSDPGQAELSKVVGLAEGTQHGELQFRRFRPGASFTFLIDLDDQAGADGDFDHLNGNEIEGGKVQAQLETADGIAQTITGQFDEKGVARLGNHACS